MRVYGGGIYGAAPSSGAGGAGDIESVTAGNGLTGGGATGAVTLNVGSGTGITVAADAISTDNTVVAHLATASAWTAAQTFGLENAGTNTVLRPVIVQRTTSSTAAASLGVGVSLFAEDASGNVDEAASYDSFWTTATDGGTQQSVLSGRARVADAMTELFRIGGGTTVSRLDVNGFLSVGRTLIDNRASDVAYFSHTDMNTSAQYAINQTAVGATAINAATGQPITFAINNTGMGRVNGTGWGFFTATTSPVAQQTIGAVTNSVTSGGTDGTIADYTIVDYATDSATIRNNQYQLARSIAQVATALRNYGLGA